MKINVLWASFNYEHGDLWVLRQTAGYDATGGTTTNDDEVEGLRGIFRSCCWVYHDWNKLFISRKLKTVVVCVVNVQARGCL